MLNILRVFCFCFLGIVILSSCNTNDNRPIKYLVDGINYACNGEFFNKKLSRIVCVNDNQDTVLIENYISGVKEGLFIRYFDSGSILEKGEHKNGIPEGVWQKFYDNGAIESYKFYKRKDGEPSVYYGKYYGSNGELIKSNIPIRIRKDSLPAKFIVGKLYKLYVDLEYSEFDSVNCFGVLDAAMSSGLKADTTRFDCSCLYYEFSPQSDGKHVISGILLELDAMNKDIDQNTVAERPFKFEYEAVEK